MAQADVTAAIVARLIAEHVEKEAVDVVLLQRLAQDFHRLDAVIAAVDAGGVKAVIDHGLAVELAEKPFGMGVEDGLLRFAEIETSDHADLSGVSFAQHVAEHVAAWRQLWARVVKFGG